MAYAFQAAMLCNDCAERFMADEPHPLERYNEDSNYWPQRAPDDYESDVPDHCDWCHVFLANRLTRDGYTYVAERVADWLANPKCAREHILQQWWEHYNMESRLAPRAYAHPGKFEGELAVAEWLDGEICNADEGDVEALGYYEVFRGPFELPQGGDWASDDRLFMATRAGAILRTNSQGFVTVNWFGPFEGVDLDLAWCDIEAEYSTFYEEENDQ